MVEANIEVIEAVGFLDESKFLSIGGTVVPAFEADAIDVLQPTGCGFPLLGTAVETGLTVELMVEML